MEKTSANTSSLSMQKKRDLLRKLKNRKRESSNIELKKIDSQRNHFDLSDSQKRIWFAEQIDGVGAAYNIVSALELCGVLNKLALEKALGTIVARHEVLRSTFYDDFPEPQQAFSTADSHESLFPVTLNHCETREDALAIIRDIAKSPFDLEKGPLIKVYLIRQSSDKHLLVSVLHHIAADGWSLQVIERELSQLYNSYACGRNSELEELPVQYKDYVAWHQQRLNDGLAQRQLDYWKENLSDAPASMNFPLDFERPETRTFDAATCHFVIPSSLVENLKAIGQENQASLFMVLLAGFQILLSRFSGERDISIGTPSANRSHPELEELIGLFSNTLVIRSFVDESFTFEEFLASVKETVLNAFANKDVPFERVVDAVTTKRSLSHTPLFQTLFVMQSVSEKGAQLEGLEITQLALARESTEFDMVVEVFDTPNDMNVSLTYSTELIESKTVDNLVECYQHLLGAIYSLPKQSLASLVCLTEETRKFVEPFLHSSNSKPRWLLYEILQGKRDTCPDTVLVKDRNGEWAYGWIQEKSSQLAQYFGEVAGNSQSTVAVCVSPSVELLIAVLAVFKAGKSLMPLDREALGSFSEEVALQSGLSCLICESDAEDIAATLGVDYLVIDKGLAKTAFYSPYLPTTDVQQRAQDVCISQAGNPAVITYQDLERYIEWMQGQYPLTDSDSCFFHHNITHVHGIPDLLWYACCGGEILFSDVEPNSATYWGQAGVNGATMIRMHFSDFVSMTNQSFPVSFPFRQVLVDIDSVTNVKEHTVRGEVEADLIYCIPPSLLPIAAKKLKVGEIWPAAPTTEDDIPDSFSVFRDLVHVFDQYGYDVPLSDGMQGELVFSERVPLLASCKISDTDGGNSGVFRTGIPARFSHKGILKVNLNPLRYLYVNGLYFEVDKVETLVHQYLGCHDVKIALRTASGQERKLVAYIVVEKEFSSTALQEFLLSVLPAYLVPKAFVTVSSIPLNKNGDVDWPILRQIPIVELESVQRLETNLLAKCNSIESLAGIVVEYEKASTPLRLGNILPAFGDLRGNSQIPQQQGMLDSSQKGKLALVTTEGIWPSSSPARNLIDLILHAVERSPSTEIIFIEADGTRSSITYRQLLHEARSLLAGLRRIGIRTGDIAVLQLTTQRDSIVTFWACVLGAITPVPAAILDDTDPGNDQFRQFKQTCEVLGNPVVLADQGSALCENLVCNSSESDLHVIDIASIESETPADIATNIDPQAVALMVLTSGSTGAQKAVMLSHDNLVKRSEGSVHLNRFTKHEVSLNWMPLDHVGGIIYFHLRDVLLGCRQIQIASKCILENPILWLEIIDHYQVTVSWAPAFAYKLILEARDALSHKALDLSSVRYLFNGGEAVVAKSAREFLSLLAEYGLDKGVICPAYGMSETSSGVTYSHNFSLDTVSDNDQHVSLGRPIPGVEMRIVDNRGQLLTEGDVGNLEMRGTTITQGYYNSAELTADLFSEDGWLKTGDLGFILGGELYVTGRDKEILIINGKNISCHQIESPIEELEGVLKSFTAACAVKQDNANVDQYVLFFCPANKDFASLESLIDKIRIVLQKTIGIAPVAIIPLKPSRIPKTSLGKIKRKTLAASFLEGQYDDIANQHSHSLTNVDVIPNWFYKQGWKRKRLNRQARSIPGDAVLFVSENDNENSVWSKKIDGKVAFVSIGDGFFEKTVNHFVISVDNADDYQRLISELDRRGFKIRNLVHLWTFSDNARPCVQGVQDDLMKKGLCSLFHIVRSIDNSIDDNQQIKICIASSQTHKFSNQMVIPEYASLQGVVATIPHEFAWANISHIDVDNEASHQDLMGHIADELLGPSDDIFVVYRDGTRWVRSLDKVAFNKNEHNKVPIKSGGLYVLVGGLGGIGSCLAKFLIQHYDACLLILGRTDIDPSENNEFDVNQKSRVHTLDQLQSISSRVKYVSVDVCDRDALVESLQDIEKIWNTGLNGVFDLTGSYYEKTIREESLESLTDMVKKRLRGAQILKEAMTFFKDVFVVHFSSVNGYFGGHSVAAYSAANSGIQAISTDGNLDEISTFCLGWSMWAELGMSEGFAYPELSERKGYHQLSAEQGINSLLAIMQKGSGSYFIGLDDSKKFMRSQIREFLPAEYRYTFFFTASDQYILPDMSSIKDDFGRRINIEFRQLDEMPLLENGEVERDRLAMIARSTVQLDQDAFTPQNETEEILLEVWRQVLGNTSISPMDNFFQVGGDSILCTQMVSRVGQRGVLISSKQVFENQTIKELAEVAKIGDIESADQDLASGPAPLSPIQHWFFDQGFSNPQQWNQSVLLEIDQSIDQSMLASALVRLVRHHDALRMRYYSDETGVWHQVYEEDCDSVPVDSFEIFDTVGSEEYTHRLNGIMRTTQGALDLRDGPLLRAALVRLSSDDVQVSSESYRLLLAVHHLVVDGVSWRILLEDLQSILIQADKGADVVLPKKTVAYGKWTEALRLKSQEEYFQCDLPYWRNIKNTHLSIPLQSSRNVETVSEKSLEVALTANETDSLLRQVSQAYHTSINDVLLTALILAVHECTGDRALLITLEGHGREELKKSLNISRTVGWFTSIFPLYLELPSDMSLANTLKNVKEQLARVPNKGASYGFLRYVSGDLSDHDIRPLVSFNYLGQFQQEENEGTIRLSREEVVGNQCPHEKRVNLLDIIGVIVEGQLTISWIFDQNKLAKEHISPLANTYIRMLKALIDHCCQVDEPEHTPSDFPLISHSQGELDEVFGSLSNAGISVTDVEDILPLSSTQYGMLYHSLVAPESGIYVSHLANQIHGNLDHESFRLAWQCAIDKYEIFRTTFLHVDKSNPVQVIVKNARLEMITLDWSDKSTDTQEADYEALVNKDRKAGFNYLKAPLMRLYLIKFAPDIHRILMSEHHALSDGWTRVLVLNDVFKAYSAAVKGETVKLGRSRSIRQYLEWYKEQDAQSAESFWRKKLEGLKSSCPLCVRQPMNIQQTVARPVTREMLLSSGLSGKLREYASQQRITLNVLFQGAWALLVGHYAREVDVVFGITTSNRPAELKDVELIAGPLLNTVPFRVEADPSNSLGDWLANIQKSQYESSEFHHTPLREIQKFRETNHTEVLFDSLLIFENFPDFQDVHGDGDLVLDWSTSEDHTETPLVLMVSPENEIRLSLSYTNRGLGTEWAEIFLSDLQSLLEKMVSVHSGTHLAVLKNSLDSRVARVLDKWSLTTSGETRQQSWLERFNSLAESRSDLIAVQSGKAELSYGELQALSNQAARYLHKQGVEQGSNVAICCEPSLDEMILLVAVLKAGCTCIPLPLSAGEIPQSLDIDIDYILCDGSSAHLRSKLSQDFSVKNTPNIIPVEEMQAAMQHESSDKLDLPNVEDPILYLNQDEHGDLTYISGRALDRFGTKQKLPGSIYTSTLLRCCELNNDVAFCLQMKVLESGGTIAVGVDLSCRKFQNEIDSVRPKIAIMSPKLLARISDRCEESIDYFVLQERCLGKERMTGRKFTKDPKGDSETIQEILLNVWSDVIGNDQIDLQSHFFEIGGDSVQTIQVVARSRDLGLILSPNDVYRFPTIESLSKVAELDLGRLASQDTLSNRSLFSVENLAMADFPFAGYSNENDKAFSALVRNLQELIPSQYINAIYPAFPLQGYFAQAAKLSSGNQFGMQQLTFELCGKIDVTRIQKAWKECVQKLDALRTILVENITGEYFQVVLGSSTPRWNLYHLSEFSGDTYEEKLDSILLKERHGGFHIDREPPLRLALIELDAGHYWLIFSYHHAILDGWSLPLLFGDVFYSYHGNALNNISRPLVEGRIDSYIAWLNSVDKNEAVEFWKSYLGDRTELSGLHIDRNGGTSGSEAKFGSKSIQLSKQLTTELSTLARKNQVTLNVVFQAAFAILISRYSDSHDVIFGTTVSGRSSNLRNIEKMVGMFINSLPSRIKLNSGETLSELLVSIHQDNQKRETFGFLSMPEIGSLSGLAPGQALFDAILTFENYPLDEAVASAIEDADFSAELIDQSEQNDFTLAMIIVPGDVADCSLRYNLDRFDDKTMHSFIEHFEMLVSELPRKANTRLDNIQAYSKPALEEWIDSSQGNSSLFEDYESISELFVTKAQAWPNAIAVVEGDKSITYSQLNSQANALAHYLQDQGVSLEDRIGVGLERSIDLVVAMLALFKIGAAYVPIDPAYPSERQAYMLSSAEVSLIISHSKWVCFNDHAIDKIYLDRSNENIQNFKIENPVCTAISTNVAYLIFTSGSTGLPKASAICHSGLCNAIQEQIKRFNIKEGDHLAQVISTSFDVSLQEILIGLCSGATLHVIQNEVVIDNDLLYQALREQGITAVHLPNVLLHGLLGRDLPDLEVVVTGGEPISAKIVEAYGKDKRLFNEYGTTEISLAVVSQRCSEIEDNPAIGRPYDNTQILILDRNLNVVPVGAVGEIYVGGRGVSRGYYNKSALTAEKFVPNPYSVESGERLYKTGDLAVYSSDGNIHIVGRLDSQVKVRGYRIELTEIENTILKYPGINSVVVTAKEDNNQQKRIAAYFIPNDNADVNVIELKAWLRTVLPAYFVPSSINRLERFPLTLTGKVDRKSMPDPDWEAGESALNLSMLSEMEACILGIVAHVVDISIHQGQIDMSFFDLGGDSILAGQVISRINEKYMVALSVTSIFSSSSIRELAGRVQEAFVETGENQGFDDILDQLEDMSDEEAQALLSGSNNDTAEID